MLNQVEFKVNDNEVYQLRLRTIDTIKLEQKLNKNVMDIFMDLSNNKLPKLNDLLMVLVYAGKANHQFEFNEKNIYSVYDRYLESGHSMFDLIPIIVDVFKTNGLIPESVESSSLEENIEALNLEE